jgi:hypothetical protein
VLKQKRVDYIVVSSKLHVSEEHSSLHSIHIPATSRSDHLSHTVLTYRNVWLHEDKDLVWRLLVIDGFSGHGGFAFRESCNKFNILVAFLLPHSTHILQPMAGGVFQPMKNAYQKKLREALRKGILPLTAVTLQELFRYAL